MSFESRLNQAINRIITSYPMGFDKYIRIIHDTEYVRKFRFEPLRSYSTTLSRRYCRLAWDWEFWKTPDIPQASDGFAQAANLIHEACHGRQRDELGDLKFNAKYLLPSSRYQFELEAYRLQLQYAMRYLGLSVQYLTSYINGLADLLSNSYFLSPQYNTGKVYLDLIRDL